MIGKEKTTMGTLIDCTIEEFTDAVVNNPHDINSVTNMKKGFEFEYQRVTLAKDSLIKDMNNGVMPKADIKKAVETIQNLYTILQKIEDRCTILEELRKTFILN